MRTFLHLSRAPIWLPVLCLALALVPCRGTETFIDLSVQIESRNWDYHFHFDREEFAKARYEGKREPLVYSRTLHCVFGTNCWLIESEPGAVIQNAKTSTWFTGTNIVQFYLNFFPKDDPSYSPGGTGDTWIYDSADGNPGQPVRTPDVMITPAQKTCWLAFCSGSFLKRPGRRIPLPSDLWKEYIRAPNGFPDNTTAFKDELGLPCSIQQFAPSTTNQTVLQYQVHQSTNLLDWNIPMEFYMVQYIPANSNGGWQVHMTATGKVISIRPGSKPEIPPEVFKTDHVYKMHVGQ